MKTAYLVEISLKTRVVVDVPEGTEPEAGTYMYGPMVDAVINATKSQISENATAYINDIGENIAAIELDEEYPYLDEWFSQTDFKTLEKIFSLRHEDFDEEYGYQAFVSECHKRWEELSPAQQESLYKSVM